MRDRARARRRATTARLVRWLLTSAPRASASSRSSPRCCSAPSAPACGSCRPSRPSRCSRPSTPARPRRSGWCPSGAGSSTPTGGSSPTTSGCSTVSVDWDVIRRDTDRAELFTRLSGWLEMPVDGDGGALRLRALQPLPPDAAEGGRQGDRWPSPSPSGSRTSPASRSSRTGGGCTRTPRWPATSSATWARSRPRTRRTTTSSATTRRSSGEEVGRSGVELSMEETLHGQWGEAVYEVDANNRIVREISYEAPVNGMDIQLSIDLDLQQYAERLLQTQLRLKRQFTVANPEVDRDPRRRHRGDGADRPEPGRRDPGRLQGPGRLGHRDEPPDRADRGDGQLPDVRQPVVQRRRRQRQVRPDLPPRRSRAGRRSIPTCRR